MILTNFVSAITFANLIGRLPGGIAQGIIWGIMALGVYISFRILNLADLSVDGTFATGGAVSVMLILAGCPAWLACICAMVSGIIAGIVTGLLHAKLGIPAILAGILTQFALYSINLRIMGMAANQPANPDVYNLVITMRKIPLSIVVGAVLAIVLMVLLYWYFGTEQGSAMRASGSNPAMGNALGINVNTMKIIGLALSNGMVALAGSLMAQYQGFADINMGRGAIVIGLAAVIIGEILCDAIFKKGCNFFIRLLFVVIGGIIYYIVMVIILWLKLDPNDLKLFTAIIVAIFLAAPYLQKLRKTSFKNAFKKSVKMLGKEDKNNA
ncbi:MAG: ABC transporter permease [Lachnospiraceae bacterium]|nr:ABC transporter permease [Lachnospiraceae bacterium]MBR3003484.1 ABC transporter permease [Lachnospiraceae bacterium]